MKQTGHLWKTAFFKERQNFFKVFLNTLSQIIQIYAKNQLDQAAKKFLIRR